jgi:hypothetical protein
MHWRIVVQRENTLLRLARERRGLPETPLVPHIILYTIVEVMMTSLDYIYMVTACMEITVVEMELLINRGTPCSGGV